MKGSGERCRPLVRVNYFEGQLLTADSLRAEQLYVRELHRRHIRTCHGWGVVEGLEVEKGTDDRRLVVEPGLALSPLGTRSACQIAPMSTSNHWQRQAPLRTSQSEPPNRRPTQSSTRRTGPPWSGRAVQETFELAVLDALPLSHQHQDRDRSRLQVLWWSVRRRLRVASTARSINTPVARRLIHPMATGSSWRT